MIKSIKNNSKKTSQNNGRLSLHSKASSRRKQERPNIQNFIQITQQLQPHIKNIPSKQFQLSRDSLNKKSRPALQEVNINPTVSPMSYQKQCPKTTLRQRQNQIFERRLSLKCTTNFSQQLQNQKSHRLSVAPVRKDSLGSHSALPQYMLDQRQSIYSLSQNSAYGNDYRPKQQIKKQAIITNFVHKLDKQQDLRSIIQSKLRVGNSSQIFLKDKKNTSFYTDLIEEQGSVILSSKLKQCQSQIKYFKNVIKELSQKVIQLSKNSRNTQQAQQTNQPNEAVSDFLGLMKKKQQKYCNSCNCQNKTNQVKQTRQISTQTGEQQKPKKKSEKCQKIQRQQTSNCFQFMDNLQKTLKVLQGKKK